MKLGHLIEGVVEQDPLTDRYVIQTVDSDGNPVTFDPEKALAALLGQEVRLTLASFDALAQLAALVEDSDRVMPIVPQK